MAGRLPGSPNKKRLIEDPYLQNAWLKIRISQEMLQEIELARRSTAFSEYVRDAIKHYLISGYRGNQQPDPDHISKM